MKKKVNTFIVIITLILSTFSVLPIQGLDVDNKSETNVVYPKIKNQDDGETEYWALLVGVGEYAEYLDILEMCETAYELNDALLKSPSWSEDHINVITGKNATVINIIKGLIWLDRMEDEDDISIVFFSTHGNSIPKDIPPKDEADGKDEILVSYWGLAIPYANILDDTLNYFLNRLESKGTAVIIDCCHAGGFNDTPRNIKSTRSPVEYPRIKKSMENLDWMENFGKEISKKGRVVIMSCQEDEVGYVGTFSPYLLDAFRGFGDANQDNIITAEEVYNYVKLRTDKHLQNPTIYDDYEGELPLLEISENPIDKNKSPKEKKLLALPDLEKLENLIEKNKYSKLENLLAQPLLLENSIVCGYIKDNKTNDPLKNANITLYWTDQQGNYYINYTKSNALGFYSLNVAPGDIALIINFRGYLVEILYWLTIDGNETLWVNVSMIKLDETSKVCGYITDNITNEPIQNANISLSWRDFQGNNYYNYTFSNSLGFYSINVAEGYIELIINAEGYLEVEWPEIGYYNISENETKWVNLTLYPKPPENSVVKGYITDSKTGEPIQNASMYLHWKDNEGHYQNNYTNTDLIGFYSINVAEGSIRLYAQTDDRYFGDRWPENGYYNISENVAKWVNLSLYPKPPENSILKGYITDLETGDPIQGATVDLDWEDDQGHLQFNHTHTDSLGFYSMNVAEGFIKLYIYEDDYFYVAWPESGYYDITENETKWVNLSLYPKPPENSIVKGYITDSQTGDPIQNAHIQLDWEDDQGHYQSNHTHTNSLGFYSMNVAAGSIRLYIDADNYHTKFIGWFDIDENESIWLNVTLNPYPSYDYTVYGYINNSVDSSPVENATIDFYCIDTYGNSYHEETSSIKSGFYEVKLQAGFIDQIFVQAEGFFDYCSQDDYLLEDEFVLWINISLIPLPPETSEVCGYITDSETDEPIGNATVDLDWEKKYNSNLYYDNTTKSDSSGFYCFDVAAGLICIMASADGYFTYPYYDYYEIDENETLWNNISLEPLPPQNAIICGYITNAETDEPMEDVYVCIEWQDFDYRYNDNNKTWTDSDGFYLMNVAEGKLFVEALIDGYLDEYSRRTNIYENEVLWINLSMYPLPPENSVVCGYIKDAETGEPLENAFVYIHWIGCEWHHQEFYLNDEGTDEDGYFFINVPAGELYLRVGKYHYNRKIIGRKDIKDNDTLWFNTSLEKRKIDVEFYKPLTAIYVNNDIKLPFFKPLILGDIEIGVSVYNCNELEKFELYIDDELKLEFADVENYVFYKYLWTRDKKSILNHKHKIKVVAIDRDGNSDIEEIEVWKFF